MTGDPLGDPAPARPQPVEAAPSSRRLRRWIIGAPRDIKDPKVLHHVSLIAFLAWVGLGADGLSSSAYGPEEAYRALGEHSHLAPMLALMTTVTVVVISLAYSSVIEHFPGGGGGYLVATKLLGSRVGVVSGCALLVDYVLTIAISLASACDQLWSFLPLGWQPYKLWAALLLVGLMIVLNLRGVRESVSILAPVFLLFIATHGVMIVYAFSSRFGALPEVGAAAATDLRRSTGTLGFGPVLLLLLRAYSLGGGTYTGIEAVSNGVASLREPRVRTGKRTMALMAISLAFTAGGILFGYLLTDTRPVEGKTMNASLFTNLFGSWELAGLPVGWWFVVTSLFAAAALLVVAAQAGFLDGPRVLANMAIDSWMPHRFAQLSDRLVAKNGVFLMGVAAVGALLYTRGSIRTLVVMYSINVFITFSLTELGMVRHWILERRNDPRWKWGLVVQLVALTLCASILVVTTYEKFGQGGWITLLLTGVAIAIAFWIHRQYAAVQHQLRRLDELLEDLAGSRAARERRADRGHLRHVFLGIRAPPGAFDRATLSPPFQELRLRLRRRRRFRHLQGRSRDRSPRAVDRRQPAAVCRLGASTRMARRRPAETRNRSRGDCRAALPGGRKGVPARDLLLGKADLPARAMAPSAPPQRNGASDPTPAPVRRPAGDRGADPGAR
jgi:amino acid transporter